IPFYWGYKPVDHATYIDDQRRYRDERAKSGDAAKLPYNAYQEDDNATLAKLGHIPQTTLKFQNDNFGNVLDDVYAKGGGTFANATTTIPDMLGPGSGGPANAAAGFASFHLNAGDFTHPIYDNPHRIYQFFAAQRLA
ncbi:TPA: alpha/beta hydrolase, partial [Citrobacter pasteurii]|nr:alpha/beta hydrolase [Citrobacter pasteurii]